MSAYYVLIAAYVASEIGVASWMVEHLQKERAFSVYRSSMFLSVFFGLIMLGRLLGAFIVGPLGYIRAITLSLVGSLLCLIAGIFGSSEMSWLLPISGLFMSITFPTVVALVSNLHRSHVGTILGILFTFGGVGGAFGPWLIGYVGHRVNLQLGLGCTIVFTIVAIASLPLIVRWDLRE
jgi:fucose permease